MPEPSSIFPTKPFPRNNDQGEVVREDLQEAFKAEASRFLSEIDDLIDKGLPAGHKIRAFYRWVKRHQRWGRNA